MQLAWFLVVVALGVAVVLLLGLYADILTRLRALEARGHRVGISAPQHVPVDRPLTGMSQFPEIFGEERRSDKGQLLIFMHAGCGVCTALADEFAKIADSSALQTLLQAMSVRVVTDSLGAAEFNINALPMLIADEYSEMSRTLGIPGTPYIVALDEREIVRVASFANSPSRIFDAVEQRGLVSF